MEQCTTSIIFKYEVVLFNMTSLFYFSEIMFVVLTRSKYIISSLLESFKGFMNTSSKGTLPQTSQTEGGMLAKDTLIPNSV